MANYYHGTVEERFWSKVEKTDSCWNWTAGKYDAGYGQFYIRGASPQGQHAHRVAFLWAGGQIPEGTELDHLCRNRACVRPDHLEPVDHRTNVLRSPVSPSALNAVATHCVNGHAFDQGNTKYRRDGRRYCFACNKAHDRRTRARLKEERRARAQA